MKRFRFTLSSIYLWEAFGVLCLLFSNVSILSVKPSSGFDISSFTILTISTVILLFTYYFIEHKHNKMKIDWVVLPVFLIVTATMLVGIWLAKNETFVNDSGVEFYAIISLNEKIKSTILVILGAFLGYGFYYLFFVKRPSTRSILYLAYIGMLVAIASLLYSFIVDIDAYKAIFDSSLPQTNIDSFFVNRNMYGMALMIGILCIFVINYYKPRLINYILLIVLFFALLSSACASCIFIGCSATVIYYFIDIIAKMKRKQYFKVLYPTLSLIFLFTCLVVFFVLTNKGVPIFVHINKFINRVFNKNYSTFTGRTTIWNKVIPHIFDSAIHALFGHGYLISKQYIYAITSNSVYTCHNTYVEIMFSGGMINFGLYLFINLYFIFCCIRLLMNKKIYFVTIHFLCVACLWAQGMFESTVLFRSGYEEMFLTILFLMPVIVRHKAMNVNDKYVTELKTAKIDHTPISPRLLSRYVGMILAGILVCSAVMLISNYSYINKYLSYSLMNVVGGTLILMLFLPYLVSLWYRKGSKIDVICRASLNTLFILFITFLVTYFLYINPQNRELIKYITPIVLAGLLLLETIFYSIIHKGSIKEYFLFNFDGIFATSKFAIILTAFFGALTIIIVDYLCFVDLMVYTILIIFNVAIYLCSIYLFSFKRGKEVFYYLSNYHEFRMRRNVIRGGF